MGKKDLMRLCLLAFLTLMAAPAAFGQTPAAAQAPQTDLVAPPGWLMNDLVCAPVLTTKQPPNLRIVGSQDTIIKHMLGPGDTLLVSGGSSVGLQPGQQFFVRRLVKTFGVRGPDAEHPVSVHTAGWIQILAVDTAIATATIVHPCEGIMLDDYLEPFVAPMIAARTMPGNLPQYANMGHILTGDEAFQNVGAAGQLINIDRGSSAGVVPGQRYLVFRDKRNLRNASTEYSLTFVEGVTHLPLVEIGELVVVSVRPDESTAQVVAAKDAISTGDFIAEIR
jgi:hypothetical protein